MEVLRKECFVLEEDGIVFGLEVAGCLRDAPLLRVLRDEWRESLERIQVLLCAVEVLVAQVLLIIMEEVELLMEIAREVLVFGDVDALGIVVADGIGKVLFEVFLRSAGKFSAVCHIIVATVGKRELEGMGDGIGVRLDGFWTKDTLRKDGALRDGLTVLCLKG